MRRHVLSLGALILSLGLLTWLGQHGLAQKDGQPKSEKPPHGQTEMPGPALSPAEAIKKMTVPEGFSVELVASEPDLVNPVAMTFDERGRIWVCESLEYPRRSAGKGRDRVKILEDTDRDGKVDKVSVFADGLNIPSGIAVGHGGVWVANAPDILFYKEKDGKPVGPPEVVVTGFGRTDTHELPNSLTWGPDGWLYGLNGVFNPSHVKQKGKEWKFTCALFRVHPRTHEFQLFAEGTSNPWGVAFDPEGSVFVSACVIDHLWHLVETGYYHRQGGPYPPYTWKIESIVKHKHQKAAYCGLHYFDSDAYPAEYRDRLYMGNIHGNCVNVDVLQRNGSTYFAKGCPDFLSANDAWFMPVAQKTGPDGCLYVLDWYDRYHCYQDANRDPDGIDRKNGRLYRIRYKDTPRAKPFDLKKETDDQLIQRLHSPNVFYRDLAQRVLNERSTAGVREKLEKLVLDDKAPRKARLHGLFARVGCGPLGEKFHLALLSHDEPAYRAWGVRAAGNQGKVADAVRAKVLALANDPSPDVVLQVTIAARKVAGLDPMTVFGKVLESDRDDPVIPHVVWQNLYPLLEDGGAKFLALLDNVDLKKRPMLARLLPRAVDRLLTGQKDAKAVVRLFGLLVRDGADPATERHCLTAIAARIHTGEIDPKHLDDLRAELLPSLARLVENGKGGPPHTDAVILAGTLGHEKAVALCKEMFGNAKRPDAERLRALEALLTATPATVPEVAGLVLTTREAARPAFRGQVVSALGRLDDPKVAELILRSYPSLEAENQPRAVELLTQRTAWSKALLEAIGKNQVAHDALSVNHVRKLLASKDADLVKLVKARWGTLREGRNPEREKVVVEMRDYLRATKGDATRGIQVFNKVCAQCHKMHGEGQEVGPDVTANGRATFDQLLSNVFDPSLVIGASYQATTILTDKGRIVTGLLAEDSAERVVLKTQGGKLEVVLRKQIDEMSLSKVSMMPEGLEKQLSREELADLFAYLCLDKPPADRTARKIPGAP